MVRALALAADRFRLAGDFTASASGWRVVAESRVTRGGRGQWQSQGPGRHVATRRQRTPPDGREGRAINQLQAEVAHAELVEADVVGEFVADRPRHLLA
jgi:hypothetical protein